jgi:demethylmenaquinone methyltransferase / 2-methoxy-6-polyprenyl-1,4-benzoquinol methylase
VSVQSAHVAELADACASGAHGETLGGSNPLVSTAPIPCSTPSEFRRNFVMETTLPQQNPSFVRRTFAAIAARYDLANHLLSGGFDFLWRARAARIIAGEKPRRILDLATGSGDLALALRKASPHSLVVAADFCLPMLEIARRKRVPALVQADGLQLPFQDEKFDALTVAFGLRNMAAWDEALQEMARVLRPGGVLLVMDFSLPEFPPLRIIYRVYLHKILPRFAAVITGNREAYEYLGSSIESFPRGCKMEELMQANGFTEFRARSLCFGVASIYTARKAYK